MPKPLQILRGEGRWSYSASDIDGVLQRAKQACVAPVPVMTPCAYILAFCILKSRHTRPIPAVPRPIPAWQAHREAMKAKFPEGWNPPRKVERGDMNTIRRLHAIDSDQWNTRRLADQFKISPEAVRRILKSKWRSDEELEEEAIGDQLERELAEDDEQGRNPVLQRSFRWVSSGSEAAGQDAAPPRPRATPLQEGFSAENSKWSARPHFDVKDVAYRQRLGGGSTRWSR